MAKVRQRERRMLDKLIKYLFVKEYNPNHKLKINFTESITERLKTTVEEVSILRNYYSNKNNLNKVRDFLYNSVVDICDFCSIQGKYENIVCGFGNKNLTGRTVIGAHYDGPPYSNGADDNGSALAVLVELIKSLNYVKPENVVFCFFNDEEHGFLGSRDFVKKYPQVKDAIILEMVGYYTSKPNSQKVPKGFPQFNVGDFLAIIGNNRSYKLVDKLIALGRYTDIPLKGLKIPFGLENKIEGISQVKRSDHCPFWEQKKPAVMLTDTAEYRNPNYHQMSDNPDTLDYQAMANISSLLYNWVTIS